MDHCENCPCHPASRPCPAVRLNHRGYCCLVDPKHPAYNEVYVRELAAPERDIEAELSSWEVRPYEDLSWLRRWARAGADPVAEVRRYRTPPDPSPPPVPVFGWVHVGVLGGWEAILREQFSAIERSGLLAATAAVRVGVVGPDADLSWFPPWATVVRRDGDLKMGENSTLEALRGWSGTAPRDAVAWYVHTKGASRREHGVTAWRDYLTYFNVLRWRDCVAALADHDACGCDYVTPADAPWFSAIWGPGTPSGNGFVGNFWWATVDHLATLPPGEVRLDRSRFDAEFAFVGAGSPRVKVFHESRTQLYFNTYGRERYDRG